MYEISNEKKKRKITLRRNRLNVLEKRIADKTINERETGNISSALDR